MATVIGTTWIKPTLAGLGAAAALFLFYFLLLAWAAGSWWHPIDDLLAFRYWIGALLAGFGGQVGMFVHLRGLARAHGHAGAAAATSTCTSSLAMIACCAHHLTDVLPLIGLAGVALFLTEYKKLFLAVGIISNVIGIIIMLRMIRKENRHAR